MRFGIRYQLLAPLVTLLAGVFAMSAWTALSSAQTARRRIEIDLQHISTSVRSVTFPRNLQTFRLMKGMSGAEFLLCDGHRKPLYVNVTQPLTTFSTVPIDLPAPTDPDAAQMQGLGSRVRVEDAYYFCRGVPLRRESGPGAILYVFYPEKLVEEVVWQAVRPALILGGFGSVIAFALAAYLAGRMTRRIQDFDRRTREIARGDFGPMPLPARNDELRDLGHSINEMAAKLAALQEAERLNERLRLLGQVSGGLAHQLRNAVTGAGLALQLHARECSEVDQESLEVAQRQLALVELHLKQFLDLGKTPELDRQRVDLKRLLRDSVELLWPQCKHASIALRTPFADSAEETSSEEGSSDKIPDEAAWIVQGDPSQLRHAIVNLVSNAVEAAGPGGWVEVRCTETTEHGRRIAQVEVVDSGPGPSPEFAERLFEPFVTGKPEGVGLGLAVVKQVALAHDGNVTWHRQKNTTCFRWTLPLADEHSNPEAER